MSSKRLLFVYLLYTVNMSPYGPHLLGIYGSAKDANSHMELINGKDVPTTPTGTVSAQRISQKLQESTGQIWYVEKHVIRDGR